MATTKVTLQIEPFDLQLICDGLALYRTVMAALDERLTTMEIGERVFLLNLPLYNGQPGYCSGQANRLLAVMGLRTPEERPPQLHMWGDDRVEAGAARSIEVDVSGAEELLVGSDGDQSGAASTAEVASDLAQISHDDQGHLIAEVILESRDMEDPAG